MGEWGEGRPAGADATLPAGVTAVPVSAARGVGWARGAGSGTTGELRDVREVLPRCWRRRLYNLVGVGRGQGAFRAVVLVWGTGEV